LLDRDGRAVLVIDEDATLVIAHSEKESAAATFKHTFGFHPVLAFCDNSNEALAGMLRPGNAGANTAADLIAVLDQVGADPRSVPAWLPGAGPPGRRRRLEGAADPHPRAA
jgi:Transposase DDE domain group 1